VEGLSSSALLIEGGAARTDKADGLGPQLDLRRNWIEDRKEISERVEVESSCRAVDRMKGRARQGRAGRREEEEEEEEEVGYVR